jgi:hypothetical protein
MEGFHLREGHPCDGEGAGTQQPVFTRQQARQVFREIVAAELRNGVLNIRRRKRLVQYAAMLELTALDAGRIVTDVHHEHRSSGAQAPRILRFPKAAAQTRLPRKGWPFSLKIGLGILLISGVSGLIRYLDF